ncbi:MAG: DUF4886 domain-containing protein [Bacteroidales bacterium]|nr:DUF4886 domain-containing protein [Bacteroidales bacterium]
MQAVLSGALLAGCQTWPQPEENTPVILCFNGYEAPATKTAFGGKDGTGRYPVLWSDTDQTAVTLNGAAAFQTASIVPSDDARSCTFQTSWVLPAAPFEVQAVSPASAVASFDGAGGVGLHIPAVQAPSAGSPDALAQLLVAETTIDAVPDGNIPLQFHHATAYGCLSLTNLPTAATVRSVDIIASVPLSGKWNYDFSTRALAADVPANIITLQTAETSRLFFGCAPANLQGQSLKIRLNTDAGVFERNVSISAPLSFKAGTVANFTVDMSSAEQKKSISILGIGNSFTMDAMQYLWQPLRESGYTEIVLAYLYEGGCSLQRHVTKFNGDVSYTYYKNTSGSWGSSNATIPVALAEREWDYITLQQVSGYSGVASSYDPYLAQLIDAVRGGRPSSKLFWHMTWAYQANSSHGDFAKYGRDQMTMYNAIISCVDSEVVPTRAFGGLIPCGTAIQNLRSSYFGDALTRDGYHLSLREGRFLAALMWCRVLGGIPLADNGFTPSAYNYTDWDLLAIKDAAETAFATPLTITQSTYVTSEPPEPSSSGSHAEDFVFDGHSRGEHFVMEAE